MPLSRPVSRKKKEHAWTVVSLLASAVHTEEANALGDAVKLPDVTKALILLEITASATDAGDTLDVFVDVSFDNGLTWWNSIHFTQQAGNGSAAKELAVLFPGSPDASDPHATKVVTADAAAAAVRPQLLGPLVRIRSTVVRLTGTDESHTFSVIAYVQ